MTGPSTQITTILLCGIKYWLEIYESQKRHGCTREGVVEAGGCGERPLLPLEPLLPYLVAGRRAGRGDRPMTILGRNRVRMPVNSIAAASCLHSTSSTCVRGWNHCMVHTGAFCLPKTKDEVKNKKSRILSFCNQGMEKMFVIVIHSTTGVNGLLRTEMLQGWVVTSKQASFCLCSSFRNLGPWLTVRYSF